MIYNSSFRADTNLYAIFNLDDDNYEDWEKDFDDYFHEEVQDFQNTYKIADYYLKIAFDYLDMQNGYIWFNMTVDTNSGAKEDITMSDDDFFDLCDNFQKHLGHNFFHLTYEKIIDFIKEFNNYLVECDIKIPGDNQSSVDVVYRDRYYYICVDNIKLNNISKYVNMPTTVIQVLPESIKEDDLFS